MADPVTPPAAQPPATPPADDPATPVTLPATPPAEAPATPPGDPPAAPVVEGVPEKYDLVLPNHLKDAPAVAERTTAIARKLGLTSNDQAQKLLDEFVAERDEAATSAVASFLKEQEPGVGANWLKRETDWKSQVLADPDVGGTPEKLADSVEKAQQALEKYFTPGFKAAIKEFGLGSHPELFKSLVNIGRKNSEPGTLVMGAPSASKKALPEAATLYPASYDENGNPTGK